MQGCGRYAAWWLGVVLVLAGCDCGAGAGGGAGGGGPVDGGGASGDGALDGAEPDDGGSAADGARADGATGDGAVGGDGGTGPDGASSDGSPRDGASSEGGTEGGASDGGAEGGAADAGMDASGPCDGVAPLEVDAMALSDEGFLVVMGTGPATRTDVRDVVRGGGMPLSCRIYRGAGEGTVPNGVTVEETTDTSGCILVGGPDASDIPGTYGFFVQVRDACGQMVEVPLVYRGRQCITPNVDITPAAWPPLVIGAGANHQWRVVARDLDEVAEDMGCRWCAGWNLVIQRPLTAAPMLDCDSMEDWCVDCPPGGCISRPATCGTGMRATLTTLPTLRMHMDVRGPERPAWIPMTYHLRYAGTSLAPCGDKEWACHLDVFERADASGGP